MVNIDTEGTTKNFKKFKWKEIDAKVTFCHIAIFCAAEVVSSPKLSQNTIILNFSHSKHQ